MIYNIYQSTGTNKGDFIIYEISDIVNFIRFKKFTDKISSSSPQAVIKREFAWSKDKNVWSNYIKLTDQNLLEIPERLDNLYLKIKYTKFDTNTVSIDIESIDIDYDTFIPEEDCEPVSKKIGSYMGIEIQECETDFVNEITSGASDLEQMLNYLINFKDGTKVTYFRTEPEIESTDVYLNEYSLHNTVEKKCIKIVVPDNEIPEHQPEFDEWEILFEEFQIHIDKTYFESQFPNKKPRIEDYIHFDHMGKMYRVNSARLDRGTGDKSTYWVLDLKVYDENTSVKKDEEIQDYINERITSHEDLFRGIQEEEEEDITNTQQHTRHNISDEKDSREFIDQDVIIADNCIVNNGTVISDNWYDFTEYINNNDKIRIGVGGYTDDNTEEYEGNIGIIYKDSINMSPGDELGFSAWVHPKNRDITYNPFNVTSSNRVDRYIVNLVIDRDIKSSMILQNGFISNGIDIYQVESIEDNGTINVLSKFDIDNDSFSSVVHNNLISIYQDRSGVEAFLVDYRYMYIKFEKEIYIFDYMKNLNNRWLGVVLNISTKFNYLECSIYQLVDRQGYPDKYSTILDKVGKESRPINTETFVGFNNKAFIRTSYNYLTNLRIWDRAIQDEYHNSILNTKVVENSSMCHIIDNARPLFNKLNLGEGKVHR